MKCNKLCRYWKAIASLDEGLCIYYSTHKNRWELGLEFSPAKDFTTKSDDSCLHLSRKE